MSPPESFSFSLNLRRRNISHQETSRDSPSFYTQTTATASRYTTLLSGMYMLLMLISSVIGSHPETSLYVFFNRLNMSFGIKYKYNGPLHHSIDRVWIVTKVALPKLEDIHFPDIAFDPDCAFVKSPKPF